jgi:hypothetical protein
MGQCIITSEQIEKSEVREFLRTFLYVFLWSEDRRSSDDFMNT